MPSLSHHLAQAYRPERITAFDPAASPTTLLAGYPLASQLLAAWNQWRRDRAAPERHDIDPLEMRGLLAHVFILDTLVDDFRFRLVGDAVNARYDNRLKGESLRDLLTGATLEETLEEHRRCAEDLKGVFVSNGLGTASPDDLTVYARLLLPVGIRDGTARHILGLMEFPGLDD